MWGFSQGVHLYDAGSLLMTYDMIPHAWWFCDKCTCYSSPWVYDNVSADGLSCNVHIDVVGSGMVLLCYYHWRLFFRNVRIVIFEHNIELRFCHWAIHGDTRASRWQNEPSLYCENCISACSVLHGMTEYRQEMSHARNKHVSRMPRVHKTLRACTIAFGTHWRVYRVNRL